MKPGSIHTATEPLPFSEARLALERLGTGDFTGAFVLIPER
jgi:hypothetical protein